MVQAVELGGVRNVAEHRDEVANGQRRQHVVAGSKHVTACEDGDDEQTADDAEQTDDDADVAVIATVLERKSHQQTQSVVRRRTVAAQFNFRCPRDLGV